MDTSAFPLNEIFSAIKRRLWLLILCVVIVTPIGLVTAVSLPSKYSSTAKILIEGQQIPDRLVRSTVVVSAAERMALLQQRLLTRQNLLDLADRMNLFAGQPNLSRTQIANRVRSAIKIRNIRLQSGRGPALSAAFTITYSSVDPGEAARVANELVSMALEQNIENRSQRATETRLFLQNKVQELAAELVALEQAIAEFKVENETTLPDSLRTRRTELSTIRSRRFQLQRDIIQLEDRQLALEDSLRFGGAGGQLSPEEADLRNLRRELTKISAVYAASHPDVRRINSRIKALEDALAERLAEADAERAAKEAAKEAAVEAGEETGEEVRSIAKRAALRELASIERQITSINAEIERIDERIDTLISSIAATPQVGIALVGLQRQQANISAQYQDAVRKEAAAADGEELEINRQGERFRVLEPAQVPENPDWPPRKLIALGGAGGSVALGAFLMLAAELRNQSVRTAGQIERRLDLRPLVTIPMVQTRHDARRRFLIIGAVVLALLLTLGVALFLLDRFYLPLDLLLETLIERARRLALVLGSG